MTGPKLSANRQALAPDPLETARGAVRDTLGSLRNAEQLLRSVKIGPKALSAVLPLLHVSCGPLLGWFGELCAALVATFPECARDLQEFVVPRVRELEAALARAMQGPVNARQRLTLEQVVGRVAADLDAARALVELLEEAQAGAPAMVDLWELTRETFQAAEGAAEGGGETLRATLERGETVEVEVRPRVAMSLIAIGVKLAAVDHSGVPHVSIQRSLPGEYGVVISRRAGSGEALVLRSPRLIGPTLSCAQAAARATRGRFVVSGEDGGTVSLVWSKNEE